jgi:anti-anti-sigma regulatory factor
MADASENLVALPAVLDLDALDDVRETLIAAIEQGSVVVSARRVERIATNALLLLASAAESARRHGFAFEIVDASSPMLSAIHRLGLTPAFAPMLRG